MRGDGTCVKNWHPHDEDKPCTVCGDVVYWPSSRAGECVCNDCNETTGAFFVYCVTSDGRGFAAFTGPKRIGEVDAMLKHGGRIVASRKFTKDASSLEKNAFFDGITEGYRSSQRAVRSVLGVVS